MLVELFALLISYLGVFAGYALSRVAKKEVASGKKFLGFLQNILFLSVLIWFFSSINISILYRIVLAIVFVLLQIAFKNDYVVLGLVFGLQPTFITSILIFLYGFPKGSLLYKEKLSSIVKKTLIYIVVGIIGLLLRKYLLF